MVLVPPYLEVDGLVVPLAIAPANAARPAQVLQRSESRESLLNSLSYITANLASASREEIRRLLESRQPLPVSQGLVARPLKLEYRDEYARNARNWESLTGYAPDLDDVYTVGATFLEDQFDLVVPRLTFIKLMEKLYDLNDAVRDGRMEPRIDLSIPMPPLRPPLPAPPLPRWTDEELEELESQATSLDELDPLLPDLTHAATARPAADRRGFLFAMLEVAHLRTESGEDNVRARYRELNLPTLQAYDESITAILAYLHDPERAAIVDPMVAHAVHEMNLPPERVLVAGIAKAAGHPASPFNHDVSVDLFRLPDAPRPDGLSRHAWLAHCEATFLHARITRTAATGETAGDLFTRVLGQQVRLRYRPETTSVMRLWRAELI
jgi:hypothetical protein